MKNFIFIILVLFATKSFAQVKNQLTPNSVRAYIKKLGIDSISKEDLLKEETIKLDHPEYKVLSADAYFHNGESFKSVSYQKIGTNNLKWITNLKSINEAKTPFEITIAAIWYVDSTGKKKVAEEFSFVVY
jgi:hypothetical protein